MYWCGSIRYCRDADLPVHFQYNRVPPLHFRNLAFFLKHKANQPFSPCHSKFIWRKLAKKTTFVISLISQPWDGAGNWNPSPWKTRTCLSCTVNTMVVYALMMQGARTSTAMILTYFARNKPTLYGKDYEHLADKWNILTRINTIFFH